MCTESGVCERNYLCPKRDDECVKEMRVRSLRQANDREKEVELEVEKRETGESESAGVRVRERQCEREVVRKRSFRIQRRDVRCAETVQGKRHA